MWGVAGSPDFDWGAPRRTPYPQPPIPNTYMDQQVDKVLAPARPHRQHLLARPQLGAVRRPAALLRQQYLRADLPDPGEIRRFGACAEGRAARRADRRRGAGDARSRSTPTGGSRASASAAPTAARRWRAERVYIVACHAIENPRLLLNSRSEPAAERRRQLERRGRPLSPQPAQPGQLGPDARPGLSLSRAAADFRHRPVPRRRVPSRVVPRSAPRS